MVIADYLPLPRVLSLGIIALILGVTIVLSMLKTQPRTTRVDSRKKDTGKQKKGNTLTHN
jgi:hypothetical protein